MRYIINLKAEFQISSVVKYKKKKKKQILDVC